MNEAENGFLTHQREPGSSFLGGKGHVVRAEAVIFAAPFLTFPLPPTHVLKVHVVEQYYSQ